MGWCMGGSPSPIGPRMLPRLKDRWKVQEATSKRMLGVTIGHMGT